MMANLLRRDMAHLTSTLPVNRPEPRQGAVPTRIYKMWRNDRQPSMLRATQEPSVAPAADRIADVGMVRHSWRFPKASGALARRLRCHPRDSVTRVKH